MAQKPSTAQAPGMPTSAIATGVVDYVVPLDDIGPTLGRLIRERA